MFEQSAEIVQGRAGLLGEHHVILGRSLLMSAFCQLRLGQIYKQIQISVHPQRVSTLPTLMRGQWL